MSKLRYYCRLVYIWGTFVPRVPVYRVHLHVLQFFNPCLTNVILAFKMSKMRLVTSATWPNWPHLASDQNRATRLLGLLYKLAVCYKCLGIVYLGSQFVTRTTRDEKNLTYVQYSFAAEATPGYPEGEICCQGYFQDPENGTREEKEADNIPTWQSSVWCSERLQIECKTDDSSTRTYFNS